VAPSYATEARPSERPPLVPSIIDAVRARASVGEISDALAERWGRHRAPV
jgi:methylmalonyl-CoA mutase N-terminal domain/subunit